MSSYTYRDRDWDESRPVVIKRYVIPSEDGYRRRSYSGDRELVARRSIDRDGYSSSTHHYEYDSDYEPHRYDRDYRSERDYYDHRGSTYTNSRNSDYEIARRPIFDRDSQRHYHHHYGDDRAGRRELNLGDSVSEMSHRRYDQDYSSDESIDYVRKEARSYSNHPHHRRNLAGGALAGIGAAELIRSNSKRDGEDVSRGWTRVGKDVGAGALGALAVDVAERAHDYYRSKSRHRSNSFGDGHSSRRHHRYRSRSRSHSRAKTLLEIGLGAAAIAGAVALARKKSNGERRSRSRYRRASSSTGAADGRGRSRSQRKKHMIGAGLAGAAAVSLLERVRSKSRPRSHSKLRNALPAVAAGLGVAAATDLYEKHKEKKEEKETRRGSRRRSQSGSRPQSSSYHDSTRDPAGLIEYGDYPIYRGVPGDRYYDRPASQQGYYSDATDAVASDAAHGPSIRRSRSRSRRHSRDHSYGYSRGGRHSSSSTDSIRRSDRKYRRRHGNSRSRSRDSEGTRYSGSHNLHEETYNTGPYAPSPPPPLQPASHNPGYYENAGHFPSTADVPHYSHSNYPPPPGAPPSHPYGHPPATAAGQEAYATRPKRADENVSATQSIPISECREHDDVKTHSPRSNARLSPYEQAKSVTFDIASSTYDRDRGYESEGSGSTDSLRNSRFRHDYYHQRHPDPGMLRRHGSDSDSTIDLPKRFDSQGKPLRLREDNMDPFERLFHSLKREFA